MSARTIKLLHIEDDPVQQRLTAQQLTALAEFSFAITTADNEDDAVAAFARLHPELVILDYHLAQGNGLSCLYKLRQQDRIVPIVAISGMATPEVAAELLQVGADDYLSKQDMTTEALAQMVRGALARADAWYRWGAPPHPKGMAADPLTAQLDDLCRWFEGRNEGELVRRLDAFEAAARTSGLTQERMQDLFAACVGPAGVDISAARRRLLRPLLLEVLLRLFGEQVPDEPRSGA